MLRYHTDKLSKTLGVRFTNNGNGVAIRDLLVRVGGRKMAFQQHEPWRWTWRE